MTILEVAREDRAATFLAKPEVQALYIDFEKALKQAGPIYDTDNVVRAFAHAMVHCHILGMEDMQTAIERKLAK